MIKIGDKVKMVKIIDSVYKIHPFIELDKLYPVVDITPDDVVTQLKYGVDIGYGTPFYFNEEEIYKV